MSTPLTLTRDPIGLRPLYYARVDGRVVHSRSLTEILALVPRELDEQALAEFVVFGQSLDPARTFYRAIHRVPPAHRVTFTGDGETTERYWSIPTPDRPLQISEAEAVERFRELFTRAVVESAGAGPVVISMSGGLDSTSVAAALVRARGEGVSAVTVVYDELIPDVERAWATEAANALGIPIEFQVADRYELFERWDDPAVRGPMPVDDPLIARFHDNMKMLAARAPVALTGQGGDAVLYTSHAHFWSLLKRGRIDRIVWESAWYALTRRRRPPFSLRSQLLRAAGRPVNVPAFPLWLRDEAVRRFDLREKWERVWNPREELHPWRNEAAGIVAKPMWANIFETYDPAFTGANVEVMAPYFDLRLLELLFALPPMPHFADKDLVRRSMRGWLPERIRWRPKTPLQGDPVEVLFRRTPRRWVDIVQRSHVLEAFVDKRALAQAIENGGTNYEIYQQTLPVILAKWVEP